MGLFNKGSRKRDINTGRRDTMNRWIYKSAPNDPPGEVRSALSDKGMRNQTSRDFNFDDGGQSGNLGGNPFANPPAAPPQPMNRREAKRAQKEREREAKRAQKERERIEREHWDMRRMQRNERIDQCLGSNKRFLNLIKPPAGSPPSVMWFTHLEQRITKPKYDMSLEHPDSYEYLLWDKEEEIIKDYREQNGKASILLNAWKAYHDKYIDDELLYVKFKTWNDNTGRYEPMSLVFANTITDNPTASFVEEGADAHFYWRVEDVINPDGSVEQDTLTLAVGYCEPYTYNCMYIKKFAFEPVTESELPNPDVESLEVTDLHGNIIPI